MCTMERKCLQFTFLSMQFSLIKNEFMKKYVFFLKENYGCNEKSNILALFILTWFNSAIWVKLCRFWQSWTLHLREKFLMAKLNSTVHSVQSVQYTKSILPLVQLGHSIGPTWPCGSNFDIRVQLCHQSSTIQLQ